MANPIAALARLPANREWRSSAVASSVQLSFDLAIVGAGPAGIAAAVTAAESGRNVVLMDDNPRPGGQIWRDGTGATRPKEASQWLERLAKSQVQVIGGARVFHADQGILEVETDQSRFHSHHDKLILATGARELFLPFPGWTLPNVVGAGGLQALVKSGLPVHGKRVVVAGTGPLLLGVAAYLTDHGADVVCICEQASLSNLATFGLAVAGFPKKILEAIKLCLSSRRVPYLTKSWPVAAIGTERLEAVRISENQRIREIKCDYLACGYHLVPNIELAQMSKCRLREGFVEIDEFQRTSQSGVYSIGEPTGIGGMELSVLEGRIAGHAVADAKDAAARLFPSRARYRKLAGAMKRAFRLRPELAALAQADTLLCRCEDVALDRVRKYKSWKEAKLHSRCGMGPCQGRICGAAAAFLFGWNVDASRPPVFPARCSSLAAISSFAEAHQDVQQEVQQIPGGSQ
jgi:NADPH-dependent 2,4-dienoyl-CoA reductase/sulfur reductase-like enzyme